MISISFLLAVVMLCEFLGGYFAFLLHLFLRTGSNHVESPATPMQIIVLVVCWDATKDSEHIKALIYLRSCHLQSRDTI